MEANELRLGNYVWVKINDKHKCIGEVFTISKTSIRCYLLNNNLEEGMFNIEQISPIVITKKRLQKLQLNWEPENKEIKYIHKLQNLWFDVFGFELLFK